MAGIKSTSVSQGGVSSSSIRKDVGKEEDQPLLSSETWVGIHCGAIVVLIVAIITICITTRMTEGPWYNRGHYGVPENFTTLEAYLNSTVDVYQKQCENFYEFACKRYYKGEKFYNAFEQMQLSNEYRLATIFKSEHNDFEPGKLLNSLFKKCMSTKKPVEEFSEVDQTINPRTETERKKREIAESAFRGQDLKQDFPVDAVFVRWKRDTEFKSNASRERFCSSVTAALLPEPAGYLFVNYLFPGVEQQKAAVYALSRIVEHVSDQLGKLVEAATWLRENQVVKRNVSVEILECFASESVKSKSAVESQYKSVSIADDESFKAVVDRLGRMRKKLDTNKTAISHAFSMNISFENNRLIIPSGILQKPFFAVDWSTEWNFGTVGFLVANALVRYVISLFLYYLAYIFDEVLVKDSNTKETVLDMTNFPQLIKCFAYQYGRFCSKNDAEDCLNGTELAIDSLGTNTAFKAAYTAFMLNGTASQNIFLSFAQNYCEQIGDSDDPNEMGKFQLQGVLQNRKEFHQFFECKEQDPFGWKSRCEP